MMRNYLISTCAVLLSFIGSSQTWEEVPKTTFKEAILASESTFSKHPTYSFQTTHNFYEQIEGGAAVAKQKGYIRCRNKRDLNIAQLGQVIVQNEKYNLTIDSVYQQIVLKPADSSLIQGKTESTFTLFLEGECVVYLKKEKGINKFQVVFAENELYKGAEIWFDQSNHPLRYILIASKEIIDDSQVELRSIQPRLEVEYNTYNLDQNQSFKTWLDVEDIIEENKGEVQLKKDYQHYQLVDLRFKKQTNE